ncbi:TIR domain-containing protein [Actinophytocola sp.]|uniref:TIR domain-containing protein n=1 Tax=Actinophytocola sp. TaxID=1872138 RepID=UPI002ECFD5AF
MPDAETLIFINYRKLDAAAAAAFLHAELADRFGSSAVFLDYESIPLSAEFSAVLLRQVRNSAVLLVVIGDRWLDGKIGRRPIDSADDWVRREIAEAWAHDVPVVPVLLNGVKLNPKRLPDELAPLARLQYFEIRTRRQRSDIRLLGDRLVEQIPQLRSRFSAKHIPLVTEYRHPIALGVHRAMEHGTDMPPPYIPRDVDQTIRDALRARKHVLLIGDSTAGKSRTAYEMMQTELTGHRLIAPDDAEELVSALSSLTSEEPHVLWLDDLHRHLTAGGLTPSVIRRLPKSVVMIATIGAQHYALYNTNLERTATGVPERWREVVQASKALELFTQVRIERRWSPAELDLAASNDDPRLRRAASLGQNYGVAEYMAAGPQLLQKWRAGWSPGGNPRGAALVAGAVDAYRAGMRTPLSRDDLVGVHDTYLDALGGAQLHPEAIDEALAWATNLEYGATSLLINGGDDTYYPFDYVVEAVGRDGTSIPSATWEFVLGHMRDADFMTVLMSTLAHDELNYATRVFDTGSDAPGATYTIEPEALTDDMTRLMLLAGGERALYVGLDRVSQLLSDAKEGTPEREYAVGIYHRERGDTAQAETFLRQAAEHGYLDAMADLGALLLKAHRDDEASDWLRRAVDGGSREAHCNLALLCLERGDLATAARLYDEVADIVSAASALNLGHHLMGSGEHELALRWLTHAYDAGDASAAASLGALHLVRDQPEEAERWWREASANGDVAATGALGEVHVWRAEFDEAEPLLRQAAEAGLDRPAGLLGVVYLVRDNDSAMAGHWWRKSRAEEDAEISLVIGNMLFENGRLEDAVPFLEKGVEADGGGAAYDLGQLYKQRNDMEKAVFWARRSADEGYEHGPVQLGGMLMELRRYAEAKEALLPAHEAGDHRATHNLGVVSLYEGHRDAAIRYFTAASQAGVPEATAALATFREEKS